MDTLEVHLYPNQGVKEELLLAKVCNDLGLKGTVVHKMELREDHKPNEQAALMVATLSISTDHTAGRDGLLKEALFVLKAVVRTCETHGCDNNATWVTEGSTPVELNEFLCETHKENDMRKALFQIYPQGDAAQDLTDKIEAYLKTVPV